MVRVALLRLVSSPPPPGRQCQLSIGVVRGRWLVGWHYAARSAAYSRVSATPLIVRLWQREHTTEPIDTEASRNSVSTPPSIQCQWLATRRPDGGGGWLGVIGVPLQAASVTAVVPGAHRHGPPVGRGASPRSRRLPTRGCAARRCGSSTPHASSSIAASSCRRNRAPHTSLTLSRGTASFSNTVF